MKGKSWKDTSGYKDNHEISFLRGGPEFFNKLVKWIDEAKTIIHFQIYIVNPDATGKPVIAALKRAAKRGVSVNFVVDDFGSDKLGEEDEKSIKAAGINFKRFEPFIASRKLYIGRRMHHKVLVIDNCKGMICGLNIADRYRGNKSIPAWLDYGAFVEGPVCLDMAKECVRILNRKFSTLNTKWRTKRISNKTLDPSGVWVRLRKNDWLRNKKEITTSYNSAASQAEKSILIVGGYFLPGRKYRRILKSASERGVDIKIILTKYSDVNTVKYAGDYLYGWMLRNNIKLYEYEEAMVHGKVAVIDEKWATIGSYNQNHLSAYLSIELNLDILNEEFAKNLNNHLLDVIANECVEVTKKNYYKNASVFVKFRRWYSYQFVRISLRLLFVMNRIFKMND